MNETVLADTGFWIALFDFRESDHSAAVGKAEVVELLTLVVPWPLAVVRDAAHAICTASRLGGALGRTTEATQCVFVEDNDFRDKAYELTIDYSLRLNRPISMVDMLCRLLIEDPNLRIDYLLTTNLADYHDVCRSRRVDIL